jgi:hypothetical protein
MRRALIAVTVSGLLLTATACGSDDPTSPDAAASGGAPVSAAPGASGAADASGATVAPAGPDDSGATGQVADTRKVCDEYFASIGTSIAGFGEQLGKLTTRQEANDTEQVNQIKGEMRKQIEAYADNVQKITAKAQDKGLVAAGEQASKNIKESAGKEEFYAKVSKLDTFEQEFQNEYATWTAPLSKFCG